MNEKIVLLLSSIHAIKGCDYRIPVISQQHEHKKLYLFYALKLTSPKGNCLMRLPQAANTALAIAGATGGMPGSPIPPIFSVLSIICTSISAGDSFNRSTRYLSKFVCCTTPFLKLMTPYNAADNPKLTQLSIC